MTGSLYVLLYVLLCFSLSNPLVVGLLQGLSPPAAAPETDPTVGSKDPEDIPTFDEWKRKMMEVEQEQSKT